MNIRLINKVKNIHPKDGKGRMKQGRKFLLWILAFEADKHGTCSLSLPEICGLMNITPSTATRTISELEDANLIFVDRRSRRNNIYTLTLDGRPPHKAREGREV